jgi:predicted DNA-binding transcriptional regulator AlpA
MAKKYLRKRAVAERYGITPRSIERMAADGRLPEPEYPVGRLPMWDEQKLDEADRAATLRPSRKRVVGAAETTAS